MRGAAAAERRGRQSVERTQSQRHTVDYVDQSADTRSGGTAERQTRARRRLPRESPAYNGAQRLSSTHSLTRHHTADSFQPPTTQQIAAPLEYYVSETTVKRFLLVYTRSHFGRGN